MVHGAFYVPYKRIKPRMAMAIAMRIVTRIPDFFSRHRDDTTKIQNAQVAHTHSNSSRWYIVEALAKLIPRLAADPCVGVFGW